MIMHEKHRISFDKSRIGDGLIIAGLTKNRLNQTFKKIKNVGEMPTEYKKVP